MYFFSFNIFYLVYELFHILAPQSSLCHWYVSLSLSADLKRNVKIIAKIINFFVIFVYFFCYSLNVSFMLVKKLHCIWFKNPPCCLLFTALGARRHPSLSYFESWVYTFFSYRWSYNNWLKDNQVCFIWKAIIIVLRAVKSSGHLHVFTIYKGYFRYIWVLWDIIVFKIWQIFYF